MRTPESPRPVSASPNENADTCSGRKNRSEPALIEQLQQPAQPVMAEKHERLHALDALRGFAMMLGVWIHAAMPYTEGLPPFFWATTEEHKSSSISISVLIIHSWRMEVFFLLSGFFTAMLVARRGPQATARHRFKRIVLPFVLSMILLQPICAALWGWGFSVQWGTPASTSISTMLKTSWGIGVGSTPSEFGRLWHFWFLYVLIYLIAVGLVMHRLTGGMTRLKSAASSAVGWCVRSWFGVFLLAVPLFIALWISNKPNGPDPMPSLRPVAGTLVYHALPFFAGWFLYESRPAIDTLARRCWWPLTIGLGFALPLHLYALMRVFESGSLADGSGGSVRMVAIACASRAVLTVGLGMGLIGIFTRILSRPGPRLTRWIRFGSDSAYWVYLVHLPLVVVLAIGMTRIDLPPEAEMLLVVLVSLITLLISYRFVVRYTPIGRLLHGLRTRRPPAQHRG